MNALMTKPALHAAYPGCRGLTLVEILIALLILSIGMLGLAGLQTLSLRFNTSASTACPMAEMRSKSIVR